MWISQFKSFVKYNYYLKLYIILMICNLLFNIIYKKVYFSINLSLIFMDNTDQKAISNMEFNKANLPNDYKFLLQKLKSIKDRINLLEKDFLEKEI